MIRKLGLICIHREEARGFSGGIWILRKDKNHGIQVLDSGNHFVHLQIGTGDNCWLCTVVYINLKDNLKKLHFQHLKNLSDSVSKPWMLIGDFNEMLNCEEKKGRAPMDIRRCLKFREWVEGCKLLDLEATGTKFTWRGLIIRGYGRVFKRLDRALCNIS